MAITVLGKTFETEEERREYFRDELRKKLPELKKMEGFPIGEDEDIIELSDPPYYTACPNPWLNDFIDQWEDEKKQYTNREEDINVTEPYANDISVGKNNPVYSSHSYHTKVPHPAIMRYLLYYTQPGDVIFDGFAGTGMTGVAASECGSPNLETKHKIENEFNRLNLISPKWGDRKAICGELSPLATFISYNLNDSNHPGDIDRFLKILSEVRNKYAWMYETEHIDGIGSINYTVWSDVIICDNCGTENLFWDLFVRRGQGKLLKKANCPTCSHLLSKRSLTRKKKTIFDKVVNESQEIAEIKPVLLCYDFKGKRFFKQPDESDFNLVEEIENLEINSWVPSDKLMDGDKMSDPFNKGIKYMHQFYFKRTLIVLSELWEKTPRDLKWFLTNSISRNLTKMNRFVVNKHNPNGRINGPLSGTLYIPSEIVEQNPFEILEYKTKSASWDRRETINYCNSATDLSTIKNESVDYIFTDPPFGSNIMYSELNSITESWLKVKTNSKTEAIENKTQGKSTFDYQELMLSSFKEFFRILKPGRWITVEFSNTSASVWNSIQVAISNAGFVISNVAALDKVHGGIKSMRYTTSVKQDLVITAYKSSKEFDSKFRNNNDDVFVWDFIDEHLNYLPIHLKKDNSTTAIVERSPKILFDRLVAFYVQKGYSVPLDASKFQKGLRERFIERDGMFFTNEQVHEYDRKKAEVPKFTQLSILVASEQDGILWLQNFLKDNPKTYQDIQPGWMQALGGERKGDIIPELKTILEENFLKNGSGEWYVPDPDKEEDLEKLRNRRLLKQFEQYKEQAYKPKGKIKECRVEALRAGFKQCYQEKDFETIVRVGDRIPNNLLMEDEVLLQFYDIAATKV